MSRISSAAPIAVRCGLCHVSVGPVSNGFVAVIWSPATKGPHPISPILSYESAVDSARAYAAIDPTVRILDLPDGLGEVEGRGLVHVDRRDGDKLEVLHESSSGASFATLRFYDAKDRKRALLFALEVLDRYGNSKGASRLGRVAA